MTRLSQFVLAGWLGWVGAWGISLGAPADALWNAHVQPLLQEKCSECHGLYKTKSGLSLADLQFMLKGGERGPALVPGQPDRSRLIQFVQPGADPHMPPGKGKQLSEDEIGFLKSWIAQLAVVEPTTVKLEVESAPRPPGRPPSWVPPAFMPPHLVINRFLDGAGRDETTDRHVSPTGNRKTSSRQFPKSVRPPSDSPGAGEICSDELFVRRLYLDLLGRIPTPAEAASFVRNSLPEKRTHLIDSLLLDSDHVSHFARVFDVVLMGRRGPGFEKQREENHWFAFLQNAFRENRPWNEVVANLIVARPRNSAEQGAHWFLYERSNDPQAMAEAIAPIVYGVQIKCAQCHDHMVAREIKQAHYWGTVAAFNRSKNVQTPDGNGVAESAIGGFVSFANLRKESQPAFLSFFNGRSVSEARPVEGEKEVDDPAGYFVPPPAEKEKPVAPAVPKFSRREAFARAATEDNPLLARAMVNRLWALLVGRGLVHPVDLMDSKHPPTHPDLLDWLATDFAQQGYDVRRLVRTIAMSRAYQAPNLPDKPLSAEQQFDSLLVVLGHPTRNDASLGSGTVGELRRRFIREFPDLFAAEHNTSLQQAMFWSNSDTFASLLHPGPDSLVTKLSGTPDPTRRVELAFQHALGRAPDSAELAECTTYLSGRPVESGARQLLWALLTSAEFQVNH